MVFNQYIRVPFSEIMELRASLMWRQKSKGFGLLFLAL